MTGKQFDKILQDLGLTRQAAAKALGMSERSVIGFANGRKAVPRRIELAIRGLVAEREDDTRLQARAKKRHIELLGQNIDKLTRRH